jgi:hypothetical protein
MAHASASVRSLPVAALLVAAACAACLGPRAESPAVVEAPPMRVLDGDGVLAVHTEDPARPRLRYVDGQVSLNQSCAIRLDRGLNPRVPPAYVNGQPIGFC